MSTSVASDRQVTFIQNLIEQVRALTTPENADEVTTAIRPVASIITEVVAGRRPTKAEASQVIETLIGVQRLATPGPTAEQQAILDGLRSHPSGFASSLLAQHGKSGRLSDRQWDAARRLLSDAQAHTERTPEDDAALAHGTVHLNDRGEYIQVRLSKAGRTYGKVWTGSGWEYRGGAVSGLSAATLLTAEQAAEFGHTYHQCVNCAKALTDDRSIAVGYGPTCAAKHGWPWG